MHRYYSALIFCLLAPQLVLAQWTEGQEGQLLIVGTDEPVYTNLLPGFAYHRELLAMTYAGIPPAAVLKAATINGARALGIDDRVGSIKPTGPDDHADWELDLRPLR